jgi:hemolysin activation/secretion protein
MYTKLRFGRVWRVACLLCLAVAFQPGFSQTPPDPSSELRRQQERQEAERQRQLPSVDARVASPEAAPIDIPASIPKDESPCFPIQQIQLSGEGSGQFLWLLDHLAGKDNADSPLRK